MFVYDVKSNTWTTSTAQPTVARSDGCAAAVLGKLYYAGGYAAGFNATLDVVEVYDPNTNTFAKVTALPTPRGDVMCASLQGMWRCSVTDCCSGVVSHAEHCVYAMCTTLVLCMLNLMYHLAASVLHVLHADTLVVVGGYYDPKNDWTPNSFRKEVEQYDPVTKDWESLAPMPVARGDMVRRCQRHIRI